MIEENDIPVIPKKDLGIIAHTYFMRNKELENVSYPDPIETEENFYDYDQHDENTTHVIVMKVQTLNSGKQAYEQTKICLYIKNQDNKQHRNTTESIASMIHDQLKQPLKEDINLDEYEDSNQWCTRSYCSKEGNAKGFY